jgi:ADP-ribose pyrophosphatase YjhB (NUDIX family)
MIRIRASALIMKDKHILAIKHRKDGREYYLLPGGGVHIGETIRQAVEREVFEELGVRVEAGELIFIAESIKPDGQRHIISPVLECRMINHDFKLGDDERIAGYDFLSIVELDDVTFYPDFRKHLLEYINRGEVCDRLINVKWKK